MVPLGCTANAEALKNCKLVEIGVMFLNGSLTTLGRSAEPFGLVLLMLEPFNTVNGNPVISPDSDEIQFYSNFSDKYKLAMRFKVKDMMIDGKLEY